MISFSRARLATRYMATTLAANSQVHPYTQQQSRKPASGLKRVQKGAYLLPTNELQVAHDGVRAGNQSARNDCFNKISATAPVNPFELSRHSDPPSGQEKGMAETTIRGILR